MKTFHGFSCPGCGAHLAAPVAVESLLCQDEKIKVNFARQEVSHECPSRKSVETKTELDVAIEKVIYSISPTQNPMDTLQHIRALKVVYESNMGRVENAGS